MAQNVRLGKLAVILHADVVGSTELVQIDERLTHQRIQESFKSFTDSILRYHGRVSEVRGDALLAEFERASDAVLAALDFQIEHSKFIDGLVDDIQTKIRVGIAIGEVIIADNTITGAGVVLAQRLEQLSRPGGVIIQGGAYETIPRRLPFLFESLGEKSLKGFEEPVRAYQVSLAPGEILPKPETPTPLARQDEIEQTDKPSLGVLPFYNLSGDSEQEYFSDGITEDIITGLSRFQTLFVIARNSSFVFKGQSIDIKEVGKRLGAQYIVEGSVRRAGDRVRITAQLAETTDGKQIWSEHYDRELKDIFSVQDEVAQAIASVLPGRLDDAAFEQSKSKRTENLSAYDYVLRGVKHFNRMSEQDCTKARSLFLKAIELDPEYARAHSLLANTYTWSVFMEWSNSQIIEQAIESCQTALSLDDKDSRAHAAMALVRFLLKQDEESAVYFDKAINLNPNDPEIAAFKADSLVYLGHWQEALDWIGRAKKLNPFHPEYYDWYSALALFSAREYEQAIISIKRIMNPDRWHAAYLAACLGNIGRIDEAQKEADKFVFTRRKELKLRNEPVPEHNLDLALERADRYRKPEDRKHFLDSLGKVIQNV